MRRYRFLVRLLASVALTAVVAMVVNVASTLSASATALSPYVATTVRVGSSPTGVAVNPATGLVYVSNYDSNTVSVISESSDSVVATIPVGLSPNGVAFDPVTNEVWVANESSFTLSVISTTSNTVINTVSVGAGNEPYGVAIDTSDGYVYNTDWNTSEVSVTDDRTVPPTGVAAISVGIDPYGLAVNSSTNNVYVAESQAGRVAIINGTTVTGSLSAGTKTDGVAVDPSTNSLFVSNYTAGTIDKFDTATNTLVSSIDPGSEPAGLAVDPGNQTVWAAAEGARLIQAPESFGTYSEIAAGTNPLGVAVDTSTHLAFVTDIGSVDVLVAADGTPPTFTSADSTSFTYGSPGSFTPTATGTPTPTITESGTMPTGVSFSDGVLSGTPTENGNFPITFTATGFGTPAVQDFTLSVSEPPAFNAIPPTTFPVNAYFEFDIIAGYGAPAPVVYMSGTLPNGVTASYANADWSVYGTPTQSGIYPLTFTAINGISPDAVETVPLTVEGPPTITSPNAATFTLNSLGTFSPSASGYPSPTISESGPLPNGIVFSGGVLAGTPTEYGTFPITFTASNGFSPDATQGFTLTVSPCAGSSTRCFTSLASDTVPVGSTFSFPVTTAGTPVPTIKLKGKLPKGVKFKERIGGATLSGTPTSTAHKSAVGTYDLMFTATYGKGASKLVVTQAFTLTVT
jgi:YVTN family beta-propeller protein